MMRWLLVAAILLGSHLARAQSDRDFTLDHQGVERPWRIGARRDRSVTSTWPPSPKTSRC